jgi:hypothetical protein
MYVFIAHRILTYYKQLFYFLVELTISITNPFPYPVIVYHSTSIPTNLLLQSLCNFPVTTVFWISPTACLNFRKIEMF